MLTPGSENSVDMPPRHTTHFINGVARTTISLTRFSDSSIIVSMYAFVSVSQLAVEKAVLV